MILKHADDKAADLAALEGLAERDGLAPEIKRNIQDEIRAVRAGLVGEREAAYEIDFYFGSAPDWIVIHDLRIVCGGRVAQIDHVVVNSLLWIYLCETKHFGEGMEINDHGECLGIYGGKRYGRPSPIEQNRRHGAVLQSALDTGLITPPRKLGFTVTPTLFPVVLVSQAARIVRPRTPVEGIDSIIKSDQFWLRTRKDLGGAGLRAAAKRVGGEALEEFGRQILALHQPHTWDWAAKFGLPAEPIPPAEAAEPGSPAEPGPPVQPAAAPPPAEAAAPAPPEGRVAPVERPEAAAPPEPTPAPDAARCATCGIPVDSKVVWFCRRYKSRFHGGIYCRACQAAWPGSPSPSRKRPSATSPRR